MPQQKKLTQKEYRANQQRFMATLEKQAQVSPRSQKKASFPTILSLSIALFVIFGLTVMIVIGHGQNTATASGGTHDNASIPVGYGSLNHPKGPCGNAGQAPCPTPDPEWFPVTSESSAIVTTAITHSPNFTAMQRQYSYTALDTPALVHAYGAHTGNVYYDDDHWVVSVRNASGLRCGIFDFVYDRQHHRMRFSSYGVINAVDPHAKMAFPYVSSSRAMSSLHTMHGLSLEAGTQPELIFFPINPDYPNVNSPVHKWAGGGNSPMDPMWHMVGTDQQHYFVGNDLVAHTQNDLPIATGQP